MRLLDIKINGTHYTLRTPVVVYAPPTGGKTYFMNKYLGDFEIIDTDNEILARYGSFHEWFSVKTRELEVEIVKAAVLKSPDIVVTNLGSATTLLYTKEKIFTPIGVEILSTELMRERLVRRGDDPSRLGSWVNKPLNTFKLTLEEAIPCKVKGSDFLSDSLRPVRRIVI